MKYTLHNMDLTFTYSGLLVSILSHYALHRNVCLFKHHIIPPINKWTEEPLHLPVAYDTVTTLMILYMCHTEIISCI